MFERSEDRNIPETGMPDYQFVTDRLAIGGAIGTAENMRQLAQAGITHVVNMQKEFDDRTIVEDTAVEILWIECADDFLPKPAELFWDAALFALEALEAPNARVLVHCAAGIHRSPMMLLAILRVLGHAREDAIPLIASARPQAEFPEIYVASVEAFIMEYRATVQASQSPASGHRAWSGPAE